MVVWLPLIFGLWTLSLLPVMVLVNKRPAGDFMAFMVVFTWGLAGCVIILAMAHTTAVLIDHLK